jgi:hypothetical protein
MQTSISWTKKWHLWLQCIHHHPHLDVLPSTTLRFQIVPLFEDSCKHQDLGVYVSPPHCIEPERLIKTRIALVYGLSFWHRNCSSLRVNGEVRLGWFCGPWPCPHRFTDKYQPSAKALHNSLQWWKMHRKQELISRPSNILNLSSDSNLSFGLPHHLPPCLLHCHCSSFCPPAHGTSILLVEFSAHTMAEKEIHDREKLFLEFLK